VKILQLNDELSGGGVESVFTESITGLQSRDDVEVYTGFIAKDTDSFVPSVGLSSWRQHTGTGRWRQFYHPENRQRLKEFLFASQVDIVHVHGFYGQLSSSVLGAFRDAKNELGTKIIQTMHNHEIMCLNSSAYDYTRAQVCLDCLGSTTKLKIFYRNCDRRGWLYSWGKGVRGLIAQNILGHKLIVDHFIAPGPHIHRLLLAEGISDSAVSLIRNPVEFKSFRSIESVRDGTVVYFGRFSREKNVALLIEAASLLKKRGVSELRIKLIGQGEEERRLRESVKEYNIEDCVDFHPFVSKDALIKLVASASVMVLPSNYYETFGLVIPEAISLGLIPVVTNLEGTRDMVEWLGSGILFNNEDAESLAQAIQKAMQRDSAQIQCLALAQKKIQSHLNLTSYIEHLIALYDRLLNSRAE
jgi:glycosyltransferase involved in cell wall biosynthesis